MAQIALFALLDTPPLWGTIVLAGTYLDFEWRTNSRVVHRDPPCDHWRGWFGLDPACTYTVHHRPNWRYNEDGAADSSEWIHCHVCGRDSYNRHDINHHWCGNCGDLDLLENQRLYGWDVRGRSEINAS